MRKRVDRTQTTSAHRQFRLPIALAKQAVLHAQLPGESIVLQLLQLCYKLVCNFSHFFKQYTSMIYVNIIFNQTTNGTNDESNVCGRTMRLVEEEHLTQEICFYLYYLVQHSKRSFRRKSERPVNLPFLKAIFSY